VAVTVHGGGFTVIRYAGTQVVRAMTLGSAIATMTAGTLLAAPVAHAQPGSQGAPPVSASSDPARPPAAASLATQAGPSSTQTAAAAAGPVINLQGRGFGHGRGMSQWGARAMAAQGLSTAQILAFYYQGTTATTDLGNPTVRVRVAGVTTTPTEVTTEPGLSVTDGACTEVLPTTYARWRTLETETGWQIQGYSTSPFTLWQNYENTCPDFGANGDPVYRATDQTLHVYLPGKERTYRGEVRIIKNNSSSFIGLGWHDVVNALPMDSYLWSVVPAEMPGSWNAAAVRAQAVAARSYAAHGLDSSPAWDVCDSTACQVYPGLVSTTPEFPGSTQAVNDTTGTVLRYNGAVAVTEFGSTNGGRTAKGSVPYQVAKADPYDGYFAEAPDTWSYDLPTSEVGSLREIEFAHDEGTLVMYGGRVSGVRVTLTDNTVQWFTGSEFMARHGLRSTFFTSVGSAVGTDWTANAFSDIIARDSSGFLWNYPGTGTGGYRAREPMGPWSSTDVIAPGDFSGDGFADIMARNSAGVLVVYSGETNGYTSPDALPLGGGWAPYREINGPGDLTGDGFVDIVARDLAGVLWIYPGTGTGALKPRVKVSSGWGSLREIEPVGDFDGNGSRDLVAIAPNGSLYLYSFSATGAYISAKSIGGGFGSYSALTGLGDFNGDGHFDLAARDSAGTLWLYRSNGSGGWLGRTLIGNGWGSYTPAS
jgi:stage II sporulation protein D